MNSHLMMTRKNVLTKFVSKREYLSHSHAGYRNLTVNYVFILRLSIRTENAVCHVVISAQACTKFVVLYFCHFQRKNKDLREQWNHVACLAPTPYQRSGM